jgi:hypothetical protein
MLCSFIRWFSPLSLCCSISFKNATGQESASFLLAENKTHYIKSGHGKATGSNCKMCKIYSLLLLMQKSASHGRIVAAIPLRIDEDLAKILRGENEMGSFRKLLPTLAARCRG